MSDYPASDELAQDTATGGPCERVLLDPRHPRLLDDRDRVLKVEAGHVDIFAVASDMRRRHLFRVEANDIILDLHTACANMGDRLRIVAVAGPGAELISLPRASVASNDPLARWITHLARLVIPMGVPGTMPELVTGEAGELQPGHRCRGPMRQIAWTRVAAGTAKFLGLDPALATGDQSIPLVGGLWVSAFRSEPN